MKLTRTGTLFLGLMMAVLLPGSALEANAAADCCGTKADKAVKAAARFAIPKGAVSTAVGKDTTTQVLIKVTKGWKWNEKYPAKLEFKNVPEGLSLAKTKYSQLKGDFKFSKQEASVAVKVAGVRAGPAVLAGKIKFSVCSDTVCVIESAPITVAVTVAP